MKLSGFKPIFPVIFDRKKYFIYFLESHQLSIGMLIYRRITLNFKDLTHVQYKDGTILLSVSVRL